MRDEKDELPANFLHELYKWALECKLLPISFHLCDYDTLLANRIEILKTQLGYTFRIQGLLQCPLDSYKLILGRFSSVLVIFILLRL